MATPHKSAVATPLTDTSSARDVRDGRRSSDPATDEVRRDGRTARALRKRERRRRDILESALTVFSEKGYHGAHVSDLISAAGIARGTFYLYFESKNAVFLELLDRLLSELRATIVGVDTEAGAPPMQAQLIGTVRGVIDTIIQNRQLSTIVIREAVGLDEEVDQRLRAFYAELLSYLRDALDEGQRMGMLRDMDSEVGAMCLLGTIKQFMEQIVLMNQAGREIDAERVALAVLDYNLHGLLK